MAKKPNSQKKRKKTKEPQVFVDFRKILELPERLAELLRELLHVSKTDWDLCCDRIRQYKDGRDAKLPRKERLYFQWSKSKGPGRGRRYFAAPCVELKLLQIAILQRLLNRIPVHFCRHGNQEGCSMFTNARAHTATTVGVFEVDIVNAFPTVYRSRIAANLKNPLQHVLRQFAGVQFSEEDVDIILQTIVDIVTFRERLPQGPPTSPRILDIVSVKMDMDIYRILVGCSSPLQSYRMTAYVDDITVSSDDEIPVEVRDAVLAAIRENGFIPHSRPDKTRYYSPATGEVPVITGIALNRDGRLTMAPRKANQLRGKLYAQLRLKEWDDAVMGSVNGTLGFIGQIYPKQSIIPAPLKKVVIAARDRLLMARQKRWGKKWSQDDESPAKSAAKAKRDRGQKDSTKTTKKSAPKKSSCRGGAAKDVLVLREMEIPFDVGVATSVVVS